MTGRTPPTADTQELRTEFAASIEEFDSSDWARIARGGSVYTSRPYLTFAQWSHPGETRYITCWAGDRLAAALPVYTCRGDENDAYDYQEQFGALACFATAERSHWYPGVLAGTRSGYVTDLLVDQDLSPALRREAVRQLVHGVRALTAASGARSAAALYLTPEAAQHLTDALPADDGGCPLLLSPFGMDTFMPLDFASFDGYLRHLPRGRRYSVRHEMSAFRSSGCTIEVVSLAEHTRLLGPFLANVQRKYGHQDTDAEMTTRLDTYARAMDELSRVFLCRGPGGEPLAYALYFVWDGVMYARNVGFDYERLPENSAVYFNVFFYAPIAHAIDSGYTAVHFGMASPAKAARGALIRPFWSLVLPPRGTQPPSPAQAADWNGRWRARWEEEYRPSRSRRDGR